MNAQEVMRLAREAASRHGVPQGIFLSQMKAESNFNPSAVSPVGAEGVGQLMPATAKELGVQNPFDPAQNLDGAARYLRQQIDRFGGNIEKGVAAYNAGAGNVEKYGGVPPFEETRNYVKKVLGGAADYSSPAATTGSAPGSQPGFSKAAAAQTSEVSPLQAFTNDLIARMNGSGAASSGSLGGEQPAALAAPEPRSIDRVRGDLISQISEGGFASEGFAGGSFGIPSALGAPSSSPRPERRMAGEQLGVQPPDMMKSLLPGLLAGIFGGKKQTAPVAAAAAGGGAAIAASQGGKGAGRVIEYLTGDRSHHGYDAGHGGSNYHEHLAFGSAAERDAAMKLLKGQGIQIGSVNDGKHAKTSYHYSDQAFDVPASQVPVGQEQALSRRVREALKAGGFQGIG
jgi:hypothetical protein